MGLTIVREIVQQHGGQAYVNGATFTVELPCHAS
jgi:signal transduction histidine kinase